MASLQQIFGWFARGLFPTEDQYRQTYSSFWHKSERLPKEQVLGLNDTLNAKAEKEAIYQVEDKIRELDNTKASKADLKNVMGGLNPMGDATDMADLQTKPKRDKDSYFVLDKVDDNGDPYIFKYDAELGEWVNTKQVVYQDVARRGGSNKTIAQLDVDRYNTPASFVVDLEGYFINPQGVPNGGNPKYSIAMYSVRKGQSVAIKGLARGATSAWAVYDGVLGSWNLLSNHGVSKTVSDRQIADIYTATEDVHIGVSLHKDIAIDGLVVKLETAQDDIFNTPKEKVKSIANSFISPNGQIISGNKNYAVDVYEIDEKELVLLNGDTRGNVAAYAIYSDKELTERLSMHYYTKDEQSVESTYLANSKCYLAISNVVFLDNKIKCLAKSGIINYLGIKSNIDKPLNSNAIKPIIARKKAYINTDGIIVNNFSDVFYIEAYYLIKGQSIAIKGTTAGWVSSYAVYEDVNLTRKLQKKTENVEKLVEVDETFSANVDCYLVIQGLLSIPNKDRIKVYNDYIQDEIIYIDTEGDSLTAAGLYQHKLQSLLPANYVVSNYGSGGETTYEIAGRMGAIPFVVEPFVISASIAEKTLIDLTFMDKSAGKMGTIRQADRGLNPVMINGVAGTIIHEGGASIVNPRKYYFKRAYAGEEVVIDRPTPVTSMGVNRRNNIKIIWGGTNDELKTEAEFNVVLQRIRTMVDYLTTDKYIVIGLTAKVIIPQIEVWNTRLQREYGSRFLNIRDYILAYGLDDAGIAPTQGDLDDIDVGEIPRSLRGDAIHFNQSGYNVIGEQVYHRGVYLGYW